ncbi:MAG: trigger factor [Deltaproteobacteria bacterium]|nr:MAG: trigger factor [Deltaproteobacteria bacterium]
MAAKVESNIEEVGPVECRVRVEIPWEEVEPRIRRRLGELRRRVRIRGFRPGKAPAKMVERMFRKDVEREIAADLVEETFPEVTGEHGKRVIGGPTVEELDVEAGKGVRYAARFEVPPTVEPTDYKGIEVRRRPVEVDPAEVDQRLERMRQELAEVEPIPEDAMDRTTEAGDVWTVDLEGTIGDEPIERTDVRVEIGAPDAASFLPGLAQAMSDLSRKDVGSTKTVEFELPTEGIRPEFAGAKVRLTLGLRSVQHKRIPDLDDEFARDTGKADSLEELRKQIEDEIREREQLEAEREARMRLVQSLLERNDFEVGPRLVGQEVAARIDGFKRQLAAQGLRVEQLGMSDERLWEQFAPEATFNVKAFLLLDAIAKAEGIEVSDEEFDKAVEELAEERNTTAGRLAAQMERSGEAVLLRAQLREEKVLDFLMEQANVTEAPDPTPEEEVDRAAAAVAEEITDDKGKRRRRRRADASDQADAAESADAETPS